MPETLTNPVSSQAEMFGRMVTVHINKGDYWAARNVIDHAEKESNRPRSACRLPICDLDISLRTVDLLSESGRLYIDQLADMTEDDLRRIWMLGKTTIRQIKKALFAHGLELQKVQNEQANL